MPALQVKSDDVDAGPGPVPGRLAASDSGRPGPDHPVWAAAAGDADATERLLLDLLPRVRNLVRYLVRQDSDVDDISQEALIVVLDGLASYRGDGPLRAWVDRIVVRSTFSQLKRMRAEPSAPSGLPLTTLGANDPFSGGPSLAQQAGLTTFPDEYLNRRRVVAILDSLPMDQRHAMVLHHVMGMTVPEIAEHTGAPSETVRSRLRLARQRVREQGLAADVGHDPEALS